MSHTVGDWRSISNNGVMFRSYRSMLLKGGEMGKLYEKPILIALNKCELHEIRNGKYTGTNTVDCECVVRGSEWEAMG